LVGRFVRYLKKIRSIQLFNLALNRAGVTAALRHIDPTDPLSWEFSGFSQHGEDGIIDVLISNTTTKNNYFVEIGTGDGTENNTSFLAIGRRYSGLMVEGNAKDSEWCKYLLRPMNYGLDFVCAFVTEENIGEVQEKILYPQADVFSLDIDGNDFWIARSLLEAGVRPKIAVVEYNSAFGPERAISIPYKNDFRVNHEGRHALYYGCSIGAWRKLFEGYGYKFVTVESSGTNAFFIDPAHFDSPFVGSLRGRAFQENQSQRLECRVGWEGQWKLIEGFEFQDV
jgi:hypothetical protein